MTVIRPARRYGDGTFLLGFESPEARRHLEEMCEGKVIARVCWQLGEGMPVGSAGFGIEFESGERLIIISLPVLEGKFLARLIWRWLPRQAHWTKAMRRHFGQDRHAAGEAPPDFLQAQIEGQMIVGIQAAKDHVGLGERLDCELRDGSLLRIEAISILPAVAGGFGGHSDIEVRRLARDRRITHA